MLSKNKINKMILNKKIRNRNRIYKNISIALAVDINKIIVYIDGLREKYFYNNIFDALDYYYNQSEIIINNELA